MIPFVILKDVTDLHGHEINEAVTCVVNGGWYLLGKENEIFEANKPSYRNLVLHELCQRSGCNYLAIMCTVLFIIIIHAL